jgi:hypothetical protein
MEALPELAWLCWAVREREVMSGQVVCARWRRRSPWPRPPCT